MTLYRLTLGQPRQEDMLALLEERGVDPEAVVALDLRPPRRAEAAADPCRRHDEFRGISAP